MQRLVVPLAARVGATRGPMETSMREESDADAATSTPGGGHSTASIDGSNSYVMISTCC
jgi:hypothetical protein